MLVHEILFALWLFWSAGVATLIPVLAAHAPGMRAWSAPMDGGKTWRGRRILGDHKTWRGFLAGWIGGSLWGLVQVAIYNHSTFVQNFYPESFPVDKFLVTTVLISLGAVVGDAVGSFCKRQLDIPSGKSWFPYDQLDFILGGIILSLILVRLHLSQYLVIIGVWLGVHLLFGVLGYLTHLKEEII
ncbi:CDP-archaeol synthase [Aeromicrobium sp.]|nr:CDP-archaeol synthase [Candidatus Saccharibacteria bacterium]